ncbi:catabolite control protein A [Granulicatella sp. zg-ZJ]|uniref:catabolite control protein A n=1 Tax=unclassified Granulicatella TaxID=2630493 RepID=UPI0013BF2A81|nr:MULTISPECIES: catabolite control protein A [unclassified Granulicatella]MBS4750678.1 catabolite control protein A [Carnobacteriaceae bacterium zg-ZUI78]NEW63436.1 catabolite control protein A [Granulicatella sp. zg-ZJ]NEW66453.1 catabolite control protein A [Granulicatella sp. zg-84]QMI86343.1 catabolite control protein A [Carnobacteriaceae bacterium zg-84]
MDKETVTIYDVAREADVSMATVSRVVNGNPNVKAATRKKVLEVIDRLDYRPNAVARGLASKRTTTVGVIIPDITNLYFSALARGIDDIAAMYKYNIILANSDQSHVKEMQVLNALLAKQVDGIIYMGYDLNDDLRSEIMRSKTPVVIAGSVDPLNQISSVNIDTVEAVKEAVLKLIDNGNKRVAFVSGPHIEPINGVYRLRGYKQALEEKGLPYDDTLVVESEYSYKEGEKIISHLQASGATAAIVGDDEIAVGILNAALARGIKVPEELEIITSNNSKLVRIVRPELSTIMPPLYDIGAVSMRLLTKIMSKETVEDNAIVLPYKMRYRGTTK